MTERDPEYDRFGPWVVEISDLDPPPPLFLPYLNREETPLLSVKIPRNIERRKAHPGMNLYDYMVTLYEEDLVILQRVGDGVLSNSFFYRDVQFLRQHESLLKGRLHLAMKGESYDLPFSTVSAGLMGQLADLIRARYGGEEGQALAAEDAPVAADDLSFYFARLLQEQQAQEPRIRVLALQADTAVAASETGAWRRILYGVIRKTLLESLHLTDGRELTIISRDRSYKYQWQTIHGKDVCTIPLGKIKAVSWEADAQNTAVMNLILQTGGGTVAYAMMRDNESLPAYTRFLSAVAETS